MLHLFFRDPIECLQAILSNPYLVGHIEFCLCKLYKATKEVTHRVYQERLSGNYAWELQVSTTFFVIIKGSNSSQSQLPVGVTLLGVILSSDKTHVMMIGNHKAHPLLISLANITSNTCNKAWNKAFMLLALLPIPKFTHPNKCL